MNVIPIDDGLTRFRVITPEGEKEFALNLIEALQQYNAIGEDCKAKGLGNFEYLDKFADWVTETTGVKINSAQARAISQKLDEVIAGKVEPPAGGPGPS